MLKTFQTNSFLFKTFKDMDFYKGYKKLIFENEKNTQFKYIIRTYFYYLFGAPIWCQKCDPKKSICIFSQKINLSNLVFFALKNNLCKICHKKATRIAFGQFCQLISKNQGLYKITNSNYISNQNLTFLF